MTITAVEPKQNLCDLKQTQVELACPCPLHGAMILAGEHYVSCCCQQQFRREHISWDFIVGERFNDERCECMWSNEEKTGRHLAQNFIAPLLEKKFPNHKKSSLRILSIGCGVGSDVQALNELGFQAYGIDAGNRAEYWARRSMPERYYLANAKSLPFANESFDVILMGCVLPHIGVGDDTYEAQGNFRQERQTAADEMVRITKPGGVLILSSPNRHCPVDFFHRATVTSHMPRLHSPKEQFLLSAKDYAKLLGVGNRCESIEILPLRGYWGFYSSSTYLLGRVLQLPVRFYFNHLMSWRWTSWMRNTLFNPWLILSVTKRAQS